MKLARIVIVSLLVGGLTTPSWAGDLRESAARAVAEEVAASAQSGASESGSAGSATLKWSGRALFVGGMAVGLYGFINDKNGRYSEFGEASSSNKHLGAAGLSTAFAGGILMLLGTRHAGSSSSNSSLPTVAASPKGVSISKNVTW
jgi:hypothetical protein